LVEELVVDLGHGEVHEGLFVKEVEDGLALRWRERTGVPPARLYRGDRGRQTLWFRSFEPIEAGSTQREDAAGALHAHVLSEVGSGA